MNKDMIVGSVRCVGEKGGFAANYNVEENRDEVGNVFLEGELGKFSKNGRYGRIWAIWAIWANWGDKGVMGE